MFPNKELSSPLPIPWHLFDSSSISATKAFLFVETWYNLTKLSLKGESPIHWCSQQQVCKPLPILFLIWFIIHGFEEWMSRHHCESILPWWESPNLQVLWTFDQSSDWKWFWYFVARNLSLNLDSIQEESTSLCHFS